MNTKQFRKLIKEHFAPRLHQLGFKGSDHHFVKTNDNHFIYTLVIQADKYGGSCVMEMGVHLDFLPISFNEIKPPIDITTYDCEFRKRLNKKANWLKVERERWFSYGETEEEALDTIMEMRELFLNEGMNYYSQFKEFPKSITSIELDEIVARSNRLDDIGRLI
ncbi:uncharacterized protein DUF4304 [Paenibacillus cellulosilyticus]|uniref:Uncharacterized protein DUF4304 n=1 Tax=Paenibacillus cellulosilyticus TaxID=375489 RepID=A0A2V2YMJ0_9BACL|nr:DUF4304 domain-containing protein [Paenibacillus cellulosilyticus]PWV94443.1 uncharacterized protein DUF4304 [Paenibacillus cellulosilyticus]QKS44964.1 DUF4304 domain-containing protein [Paenibacillus cellulosilyticus]